MIFIIIGSYIVCYLLCYLLAKKFNFIDYPSDIRKVHNKPTAFLGGCVFLIGLLFIAKKYQFDPILENILIYSFLLLIIGILDDKINLTPGVKILFTFFPIILIVPDLNLKDLGVYDYIGLLSLGKFGVLFTMFSIYLIMNSVNYIDGIDGNLLIHSIISFSYIFFLNNNFELNQIIKLILIFLLINFCFTFTKFKMFMGNSGSLIIGYLLSLFTIYLYVREKIHPSYLIWILNFYVYDFLSVNIYRIINKKNIFSPGIDHMHHLFLKFTKTSHMFVSVCLGFINFTTIILGYLITKYLSNFYSIIAFVIFFFLFLFLRNLLLQKIK